MLLTPERKNLKNARYLYGKACDFQKQRKLSEALENFQRVLTYDGSPKVQNLVISSYYHISLIYDILEKNDEKRKYALRCLKYAPNHRIARLLLDMPQEPFWENESNGENLFVLEDVPYWERLVQELLKYAKGIVYHLDLINYLSQVYRNESYKGTYDASFLNSVSPYAISFVEKFLDAKKIKNIYFWGNDEKTYPKNLLINVALATGRSFEKYPGT